MGIELRGHGCAWVSTARWAVQVDYEFPARVPVSDNCKDLLRRILVADPTRRLTIAQIQQHPWYRQVGASGRAPALAFMQASSILLGRCTCKAAVSCYPPPSPRRRAPQISSLQPLLCDVMPWPHGAHVPPQSHMLNLLGCLMSSGLGCTC